MEVIFTPAAPRHFFFAPLKHLPPSSVPREAGGQVGKQGQSWSGRGRQGEVAQPQVKDRLWCFLPTLVFHFPRSQGRQAHGTRTGGGEQRVVEAPHRLWPTHKAG